MRIVAIMFLMLFAALSPQQTSRSCLNAPHKTVTVGALRDTRCPDGRRAYLDDTVTIAGRVTMGTGDLSLRVLHIIVQDSSGGMTVVGPTGSGPWVAGDSVEVHGVLVSFRDALALDGRSISHASGPRAAPAPESIVLSREALSRNDGRLVRLTGRVIGRGGEPPRDQLYIRDRKSVV